MLVLLFNVMFLMCKEIIVMKRGVLLFENLSFMSFVLRRYNLKFEYNCQVHDTTQKLSYKLNRGVRTS